MTDRRKLFRIRTGVTAWHSRCSKKWVNSLSIPVIWYLAIGAILTLVGINHSLLKRLPVTPSIVYLMVGIVLGEHGLQIIGLNLADDAELFEHITEIVVMISLFCAALKLRAPLTDPRWHPPVRLAVISMSLTVGFIACIAHYAFHFSWGAAVLLGGILAPTDPVLASEVQVRHERDRDRLRFSLTGEAGLNDGTAFPFVMLGLGMLGYYELGDLGSHWFLYDGLWAVTSGIGVGWVLGKVVSNSVLWVRQRNEDSIFLDDFLSLGLIALAYGISSVIGGYGFLAVFVAGLTIQKIEPKHHPHSKSVLAFTEQMERLGEVLAVILIGSMINVKQWATTDLLLVPILFLVIRPLAVWMGLFKSKSIEPHGRMFTAWFGIRGIGSIFYLAYAINHGLSTDISERLITITIAAIVVSIFLHGITALPVMEFYQKKKKLS